MEFSEYIDNIEAGYILEPNFDCMPISGGVNGLWQSTSGLLDGQFLNPNNPDDLLILIENYDNPDLELILGDVSFVCAFILLNNQKINLTYRKAMSFAFNYPYLMEEALQNNSVRATSCINPKNKYYNASIGLPNYNLTYARDVLIEAGIVGSEASTWTDQDWKDIAESDTPLKTVEFWVFK